ncbi:MAG TPA: histidine kinase [Solirubrobacteraceae bacterium]
MAFVSSAGFFAATVAAVPLRGETVLVVLWCLLLAGAVGVAAWRLGPLLGVPLALAAAVGIDSFYIAPYRTFSSREWVNYLVTAMYIAIGVFVGAVLATTRRRIVSSEAERGKLAEEQAALRRVATLVARGSSPAEVFAQVAEEVALLLGVENATMHRYEGDGNATIVAIWGKLADAFPVGTHLNLEEEDLAAMVRDTWQAARIDDYSHVTSRIGASARESGVGSAVGSPIVVEGQLWGAMTAATLRDQPLPAEAGSRIREFTELVATAISNTQARSELASSRGRVVAAADEERRRVVRDLHDGAQQRLVHTVITLKLARRSLDDNAGAAAALVSEALKHAEEATAELRELAHGILPAALTSGGLRAGVAALVSRMPIPVHVGVSMNERLPAAVEATAYFLVAEALTNVTKHARARHAEVTAHVRGGRLEIRVRDDGVGGARTDGSGLLGLGDRLGALDGSLQVDSPADGGTLVMAVIPFQVPGSGLEERPRRL